MKEAFYLVAMLALLAGTGGLLYCAYLLGVLILPKPDPQDRLEGLKAELAAHEKLMASTISIQGASNDSVFALLRRGPELHRAIAELESRIARKP